MRAVEDHHVDRPDVEAWQHVKLTGTNCSIGLTSPPSRAGPFRVPGGRRSPGKTVFEDEETKDRDRNDAKAADEATDERMGV